MKTFEESLGLKILFVFSLGVIPHIGSAETSTRIAMAELTAKNIICGIEGSPLPAEIP